jgi:hypothetical protein
VFSPRAQLYHTFMHAQKPKATTLDSGSDDDLLDVLAALPVSGLPTVRALYQAVARGEVPHIRLSRRRLRFWRSELLEWRRLAAARNRRVTVAEALTRLGELKGGGDASRRTEL